MLFLFNSSEQVAAQAPAPRIPGEWISLVEPASNQAATNDNLLGRDTNFNRNRPLADLRQPDPSGLLTEDPPVEQFIGNTSYSNRQNRSEETLATGWSQPELRYRRLFFEDKEIERGNSQRRFPNFAAGTNFVKSLVAFPVRLITGR